MAKMMTERIDFNRNWKCRRKGDWEEVFDVTLPHDAMLLDKKSEDSPGGKNTGWYDACDYIYSKRFHVPESFGEKCVMLEFEGVYQNASVYLNGKKIGTHEYGYTGFFLDITKYLRWGKENVIEVEAGNSAQPNSRWYTGTGIYRPVWLYVLPKHHILPEEIRITTLDYRNPRIRVDVMAEGTGQVQIDIMDGETVAGSAKCEAPAGQSERNAFSACIELPEAELWEPEHPRLYVCRVAFGDDVREERFGIRVIESSPENGFCINGKRVILRGACIHHDNGVLGARAYEYAEYRKVRILREAGYNAIRSAHNPCSKALLEACDRLGMLVVDEYADMWYIHKTKYDYAPRAEENYEDDLKTIVFKDYNHPSVVMYSIGNEVSETAQKRGIRLCGNMTEYLHSLDPTRPVTCGINIFFNFLSSVGMGVYSDKKAASTANSRKKKAVGSEFFNNMAGIFGADFMKTGAVLYPCDVKTRDAFAKLDIAGYNYGIKRYEKDLKKYPSRLILGTETFCSDAYRFIELAKENKRIIGDFVWSGMDYLGETGIGAWEYKDYAPRFDGGLGWVGAGAGRIDLTGKPLAEMRYTRVAFGIDKIGIGVVPPDHAFDSHSPSSWKMTNAVESWSWNGCGGKKTKVEIYARAHHVSLYVNGKCVGTKKMKNDCRAVFQTWYHDGEVRAVSFDKEGNQIAETSLKTAGNETMLRLEPELDAGKERGELLYVRMRYTDKDGITKPLARGEISLEVKGGRLLGCGSACPFYEKSYLGNTSDTYYGEAIAVICPDGAEDISVEAKSPYGRASADVPVQWRDMPESKKWMEETVDE